MFAQDVLFDRSVLCMTRTMERMLKGIQRNEKKAERLKRERARKMSQLSRMNECVYVCDW